MGDLVAVLGCMDKPPKDPVDEHLEDSQRLIDEIDEALTRARVLIDAPVPATPPAETVKTD
jgi:hypothetical protein